MYKRGDLIRVISGKNKGMIGSIYDVPDHPSRTKYTIYGEDILKYEFDEDELLYIGHCPVYKPIAVDIMRKLLKMIKRSKKRRKSK